MIDGSIQNLWESTFLVTVRHVLCTDGQIKLWTKTHHHSRTKKNQDASNTPLANLQSHTSQRKRPNLSHLACAANAAQAD